MTPAIDLLRTLEIDHRVVGYESGTAVGRDRRTFGEEAAAALGLDDGSTAVGVVPVSCTLDLKAIASAAGAKRATMTDPADAERRTGYVVGGISPFGQRRPSPTFVDEWATALDVVHCSAGRRGLELVVSPTAFTTALGATFAPIASWP